MAINFIPKIVYDAGSGPVTIEFDYPPEKDPLGEKITSEGASVVAADGNEQYNEFYQEENFNIRFKRLTVSQVDALRTMYKAWALKGNGFDYYQHKSEAGFETYKLDRREFDPKRTSSDGSDDFFYSLEMRLKRVIT